MHPFCKGMSDAIVLKLRMQKRKYMYLFSTICKAFKISASTETETVLNCCVSVSLDADILKTFTEKKTKYFMTLTYLIF